MEAAFDLLRDRRYLDLSALDMSGAVVSFGVYSDAFLEELLSWQIDQGPSVYGQFPPLLTQSLWVAKGKLHRRAVEEYVDFAAGCLAETDGVGDILSNLKPGEMYNLLEVFGSNSDKRTWQRAFEEVCNFVARDVYLSHLSLRDLAMIMAAFVRSKGSIEAPGLSHVMPRLTGTVSTLLSSGGSAGRIRPDWAALIANAIAKALLHPADDKVRLVMSRLLSETLKDGKEPDNIAKVYLAAAKLELLPPTSSSHWLHSRINISVAALTMLMLSAALSRSTQLFRAVVLVLARRAFTDDLSEACKYQIITGMLGMWPVSDPTLEELKAVRGVLNGVRLADLQASSSSFAQIASTRDHVGCLETLRGSLHGSNGSVSPPYHIVTEAFALPYWIDIVMLPIGRSTGESKSSVLRPTNYQHATSKFLESPFRAEPQANSSGISLRSMKEPSSASEDCSSDGSEYDDVDWASPFDDDMASASTTPAEPRKVEEVERPRARKRRKISRPVSRKEVMVWFNSLENLARLCFESESIKKAAAGRMCDLGVTCDDAPMMAPWPPYWLVSDPSTLDLTLDPLPGPESIADELALSEMGVSTYVGALAATSAVLQEDATIFMAATGYPMPWLEIDKGQAVGFPPSKSRSLGVVVGKKKAGDFFDASAKYGSSRRLKVLSWLRIPPGQDDGKLPKSVEGFKNSGTYILESQLTRFDSLVDTARPVGVFSGRDPIYLRKDVLRLRSESQWERRGLVLTSESCECRRVLSIKGKTVRLYSEDQTVEAPHKSVGVDGEIPVNRFGFVDLTDGRQPPEGSECVEGENLRRLIRKCKEQGIEHWAPAHVGWMAQRPQIGGVVLSVVAISHASALRNAMEEESCSRKAAEHSKEEHLAKLAWKALIKRLLARRYVEMISGSSSSSSS